MHTNRVKGDIWMYVHYIHTEYKMCTLATNSYELYVCSFEEIEIWLVWNQTRPVPEVQNGQFWLGTGKGSLFKSVWFTRNAVFTGIKDPGTVRWNQGSRNKELLHVPWNQGSRECSPESRIQERRIFALPLESRIQGHGFLVFGLRNPIS